MRAEIIRRAKSGLLDDDELQLVITEQIEEDPAFWTGSGKSRTGTSPSKASFARRSSVGARIFLRAPLAPRASRTCSARRKTPQRKRARSASPEHSRQLSMSPAPRWARA